MSDTRSLFTAEAQRFRGVSQRNVVFQAAGYIFHPMPTVHTQDGFDVMIYTRDHLPAHAHVWKAGTQVLINLGDEETRVSVRENKGMSTKNILKVLLIVAAEQTYLLEKWREIHG